MNWQKLKKEKNGEPIMVLAPMADVTDAAFRQIIAKYGKPDVMWTEFVSADGLVLAPRSPNGRSGGYDHLIKDLQFSESERPIVAQFFTSRPDMMEKVAALAVELGFDGVDINMGCPDSGVERGGAGAALIKTPELAKELILAAKRGTQDKIPVSVKTRIGYNKNELETWLPILLSAEPAVITIHARTRKEMSKVPARWEHIKRAVEIRDEFFNTPASEAAPSYNKRGLGGVTNCTLIFGNGDVENLEQARKLAQETGADGVMLGRAIFGNPWLFANLAQIKSGSQIERPAEALAKEDFPSVQEKLKVLIEHTNLFEQLVAHKNFAVMKKHFKAYVNGFDGAKELRMELMETNNAREVEEIIQKFLSSFDSAESCILVPGLDPESNTKRGFRVEHGMTLQNKGILDN